MENSSINIVQLMENTPVSKLSKTYNNKFINKIKESFNEDEQKIFISSFFCYLNYHPMNDYVISMDDVWKWLDFAQKATATRLLKNHFEIEKDYKCLLTYRSVEQRKEENTNNRGGHNKETILMNLNTFKLFCIKADTKKAKSIQEYLVKMEHILHEIIQEESNELKEQLQEIGHIKINFNETLKKTEILQNEQLLLTQYGTSGALVYLIKVKTFDDGKYVIKIGQSAKGVKARYDEHKTKYPECLLLDCYSVLKSIDFEKFLHNTEKIRTNKYNKLDGHEKETELFLVGGNLTYNTITRIITENIKQFNEYTKLDFELLQSKIELLETKNELLTTHLKEQKLYVERIEQPLREEKEFNENNSEKYIINKLNEIELQNKQIMQTITINKESRLLTGFGQYNKTVGPRLLQINPETNKINKIYETVADCLKESNFKHKRPSIEKSVHENIVYNGYRWLYAERDEDPEEIVKSIQQSKDTKIQNIGYIAKLNKEKTEILNVYIDRKTASIKNGFTSPSSLDAPVKNGTIMNDHYYTLYDKCDDIVKGVFNGKIGGVPLLYKNGVGRFDKTGKLMVEYVCKYDCIKRLNIGDKTLSKILDKEIAYNDYFYRTIGSKLCCL